MRRQVINLAYQRTIKWVPDRLTTKDVTPHLSTWYERLAWWLVDLLCIRFTHHRTEDSYTNLAIDANSIIKAVDLSVSELRLIHNLEAKYLLIGNKQAHELIRELPDLSYFQFHSNVDYHLDDQYCVRGLTMIVVPWMDGFCLLPELR